MELDGRRVSWPTIGDDRERHLLRRATGDRTTDAVAGRLTTCDFVPDLASDVVDTRRATGELSTDRELDRVPSGGRGIDGTTTRLSRREDHDVAIIDPGRLVD